MCIDWILLACLHLQMEACVLFYPEKATEFCAVSIIRKETVDFFTRSRGYIRIINLGFQHPQLSLLNN